MDRVTNGLAERICEMLRDEYLTGAEAQRIRCAAGEAERRRTAARIDAERAALEAYRERVRRHLAKGAEVPQLVWDAVLEAEAVAQGQDGPDPAYHVAPRFGGVETRAVPVPEAGDMCADWGPDDRVAPAVVRVHLTPDPAGGFSVSSPDLPGLNTEGETVAEALEMAADAARELSRARDALAPVYAVQQEAAAMATDPDDDDDDTPLMPPFTDEQEGE